MKMAAIIFHGIFSRQRTKIKFYDEKIYVIKIFAIRMYAFVRDQTRKGRKKREKKRRKTKQTRKKLSKITRTKCYGIEFASVLYDRSICLFVRV